MSTTEIRRARALRNGWLGAVLVALAACSSGPQETGATPEPIPVTVVSFAAYPADASTARLALALKAAQMENVVALGQAMHGFRYRVDTQGAAVEAVARTDATVSGAKLAHIDRIVIDGRELLMLTGNADLSANVDPGSRAAYLRATAVTVTLRFTAPARPVPNDSAPAQTGDDPAPAQTRDAPPTPGANDAAPGPAAPAPAPTPADVAPAPGQYALTPIALANLPLAAVERALAERGAASERGRAWIVRIAPRLGTVGTPGTGVGRYVNQSAYFIPAPTSPERTLEVDVTLRLLPDAP